MAIIANNGGLLTTSFKTHDIEKFYYSPISLLSDTNDLITNLYCFIGYRNPDTANSLQIPVNSNAYLKSVYKSMFAAKRITNNELSPVIEKIKWSANTFYDIYTDKEDMFEKDINGKLMKKFYVVNRFDQVFKCLWNGKNRSNTYSVSSITRSNTIVSIEYSGLNSYSIGEYITLQNCNPADYNGTYRVVSSTNGKANVAYGLSESYKLGIANTYISGGRINKTKLSTVEPYLDAGTFDTSLLQITSDGYKWKYIYTIDKGRKEKFYDNDYIPVPIKEDEPPNIGETSSKAGSIDIIGLLEGGSGYSAGTDTVDIKITGDGYNANAIAYITSNSIVDILVTSPGYGYTYADLSITPSGVLSGNGANAEIYISPIGGHGFDPIEEFGCDTIMISCEFQGNESGKIPTNLVFNQLGLLVNPYELESDILHANGSIYTLSTAILTTPSITPFRQGELIYQGTSITDYTFIGECLSFDPTTNALYVINSVGVPRQNYAVIGASSGGYAIISGTSEPTMAKYTGNIVYVENIETTQRDSSDTEQFRLIVKY
jgi:hypothetical protein